MLTHYDALNVTEDASPEVIRAAYKALAQKWHPDRHAGMKEHAELRFKVISAAYEILSNPDSRRAYDQNLLNERQSKSDSRSEFKEPQPEAPASEADKNKFYRLWSGDVSVAEIFWIYIIALPVLSALLLSVLYKGSGSPGYNDSLAPFIFLFGFVVYSVFIHICLWRSASKSGRKLVRGLVKVYCFAVLLWPVIGISASIFSDRIASSKRQEAEAAQLAEQQRTALEQQKRAQQDQARKNIALEAALANRQISLQSEELQVAHRKAVAANSAELEQAVFDDALLRIYKKYPYLDSRSPLANSAAINEVIESANVWVSRGHSRTDAVIYAADSFASKSSPETR